MKNSSWPIVIVIAFTFFCLVYIQVNHNELSNVSNAKTKNLEARNARLELYDKVQKKQIEDLKKEALKHPRWRITLKTQIIFEEYVKSDLALSNSSKHSKAHNRSLEIATYKDFLIARKLKESYYSLTDLETEIFINYARYLLKSITKDIEYINALESRKNFDNFMKALYCEVDGMSMMKILQEKGTIDQLEKEIDAYLKKVIKSKMK